MSCKYGKNHLENFKLSNKFDHQSWNNTPKEKPDTCDLPGWVGGWDCYISLLCTQIILTLLRALRAVAKSSIIFPTQTF